MAGWLDRDLARPCAGSLPHAPGRYRPARTRDHSMTCHQYRSAIRMLLALSLTAALLACRRNRRPLQRSSPAGTVDSWTRKIYNDWISWQGKQASIETVPQPGHHRVDGRSRAPAGCRRQSRSRGWPPKPLRQRILLPALDNHLRRPGVRFRTTNRTAEGHLSRGFPPARKKTVSARNLQTFCRKTRLVAMPLSNGCRICAHKVLRGDDLKALASSESESQNRFRDGSLGFVDPAALPTPRPRGRSKISGSVRSAR